MKRFLAALAALIMATLAMMAGAVSASAAPDQSDFVPHAETVRWYVPGGPDSIWSPAQQAYYERTCGYFQEDYYWIDTQAKADLLDHLKNTGLSAPDDGPLLDYGHHNPDWSHQGNPWRYINIPCSVDVYLPVVTGPTCENPQSYSYDSSNPGIVFNEKSIPGGIRIRARGADGYTLVGPDNGWYVANPDAPESETYFAYDVIFLTDTDCAPETTTPGTTTETSTTESTTSSSSTTESTPSTETTTPSTETSTTDTSTTDTSTTDSTTSSTSTSETTSTEQTTPDTTTPDTSTSESTTSSSTSSESTTPDTTTPDSSTPESSTPSSSTPASTPDSTTPVITTATTEPSSSSPARPSTSRQVIPPVKSSSTPPATTSPETSTTDDTTPVIIVPPNAAPPVPLAYTGAGSWIVPAAVGGALVVGLGVMMVAFGLRKPREH